MESCKLLDLINNIVQPLSVLALEGVQFGPAWLHWYSHSEWCPGCGCSSIVVLINWCLSGMGIGCAGVRSFCAEIQYRLYISSSPGRVHKLIGRSAVASGRVFLKSQTRPQQKLDASRFLMDADAVQTGRVQRLQWTRPATLVDESSKNNGRVRSEEQARPSVNPSAST